MISSRRATSFGRCLGAGCRRPRRSTRRLAEAGPQADRKGGHHGKWGGGKKTSVEKLLKCVTLKGVMQHQRVLQRIADRNDGTRSAGTPGYDASAAYVKDRLRRAGYRVQPPVLRRLRLRGGRTLGARADRPDSDDVRPGHRLRRHTQSGRAT